MESFYLLEKLEQERLDLAEFERSEMYIPAWPPLKHFETIIINGRRTRPRPSSINKLIW